MAAFNGPKVHYHQVTSLVTPHTTWRFGVRFFLERNGHYGLATAEVQNEDVVLEILPDEIISIGLPTIKDTVSVRNFMNTRRSYNTGRNMHGSFNMKFNVHPMFNPLYDVYSMKAFNLNEGSQLVPRVYLDSFRRFNAVEISLLSSDASNAIQKQIVLQNVHFVDINADELNYESESKLTVSIQCEYDNWYWSQIDHISH